MRLTRTFSAKVLALTAIVGCTGRSTAMILPSNFASVGSTDESSIVAAEKSLRVSLPSDYKSFLRSHNGGDGMLGDTYVMFWGAHELAEYNVRYEVGHYAAGLVLFGSNGGGEAFAFDMRSAAAAIVMVPFVGMIADLRRD